MLFVSRMDVAKYDDPVYRVSISESRCFSFQVMQDEHARPIQEEFQSRNRDAFRFKFTHTRYDAQGNLLSFNLGIEMLFVSSL